MPKLLRTSLPNRRLLPLLALAALLATLLLSQPPSVRGVKASVKTVVTAPCTSAFIGVAASQPQAPGATFSVNASSGGCGTPEYRFLFLAPGSATWVFKTAYGSNASYQWATAGLQQGVWQIGVWVRAVGSTARYQAWSLSTFALVVQYCTSLTLSYTGVLSSTEADLTVTAAPTGCPTPLFKWLILKPGSSTWTPLKAYSSAPSTVVVITSPLGGYKILAEAIQTGSTHRYDTYAQLTFWW